MKSSEFIKEDAGVTGSSSIAAVVTELGGGLGKKELIKRQQGYTNQRTPGSVIKGVKAAKVK